MLSSMNRLQVSLAPSTSLKYNIKVLPLEYFHYTLPYKSDGSYEAYNKIVEYDPPSGLN